MLLKKNQQRGHAAVPAAEEPNRCSQSKRSTNQESIQDIPKLFNLVDKLCSELSDIAIGQEQITVWITWALCTVRQRTSFISYRPIRRKSVRTLSHHFTHILLFWTTTFSVPIESRTIHVVSWLLPQQVQTTTTTAAGITLNHFA